MRKIIVLLVGTVITAMAGLSGRADQTKPTLDLSNGHDYSLLQKGGVNVQKGTYVTSGGGRSSDRILDKSVVVTIGPGKSFTMQSSPLPGAKADSKFVFPAGTIGVGKDDSVIQFLAFETICLTPDSVKAKIKEIGRGLGFDESSFYKAIDGGDLAKRTHWANGNEGGPLFWAVQVDNPILPSSGYTVWVYITWDKALINRLCPMALMARQ